jgi:peroxiredoxin
MSGPQFFQTRMGQTFFEGTMPRLYRAVGRLADVLGGAPREYRTVCEPNGQDLERELNKLGEEGFRVVGVTDTSVILERVVPSKEQR